MNTEITEKVIAILGENLDLGDVDITTDTKFSELGLDSFDMLELVVTFEDEFGFEMADDVLEKIETVGDAVTAIADAQ